MSEEDEIQTLKERVSTLETELEDVKTRCVLVKAVLDPETTLHPVKTEDLSKVSETIKEGEESHVESDSTEDSGDSEAQASDPE